MNRLFLFFILFVSLFVSKSVLAQKRTKKVVYVESRQRTKQADGTESYSNARKIPSEVYYVSASDTNLRDSLYIKYFATSQCIEQSGYYNIGLKTGIWKEFYETNDTNVKVKSSQEYRNDTLNGVYESFRPTSEKRLEGFYQNGRLIGSLLLYFQNGECEAEVLHENGLKEGKSIFYHQGGTVRLIENYSQGLKSGGFISYFSSADTMQVGTYFKDQKVDTLTTFFENGRLKQKVFFEKDSSVF